MSNQGTVYLSNLKCGSVVQDIKNRSALSVSEARWNKSQQFVFKNGSLVKRDIYSPENGTIEVKILAFKYGPLMNLLTIKILPLGKDPLIDTPVFYGIIAILATNTPGKYVVRVFNPFLNLDKWCNTSVRAKLPRAENVDNSKQFGQDFQRTSGPGLIPENKSDVVLPTGPFDIPFETNSIVPGQMLYARWKFIKAPGVYAYADRSKECVYWSTAYIKGGYITQIIGEYGDLDISFLVMIEGSEITCYPSDYIDWEVGDWVFVANVSPKIIIPFQVDGVGA